MIQQTFDSTDVPRWQTFFQVKWNLLKMKPSHDEAASLPHWIRNSWLGRDRFRLCWSSHRRPRTFCLWRDFLWAPRSTRSCSADCNIRKTSIRRHQRRFILDGDDDGGRCNSPEHRVESWFLSRQDVPTANVQIDVTVWRVEDYLTCWRHASSLRARLKWALLIYWATVSIV